MDKVQGEEGLRLAGEVPAAGREQWQALVAKVLKGDAIERRLVRRTADGIPIQPLYTEAEAGELRRRAGLPGSALFVRGHALSDAATWDVRQRHAHPDAAVANAQILEDLERGVTSIQLRLDRALAQGGATPDGVVAYEAADLERTLDGVLLDLAPIGLDAGSRFTVAASMLLELARRRGLGGSDLRADLNADPLGAAVAGERFDLDPALAEAGKLAAEVAEAWPGVTALLADGRPYHAGGASEAQELGSVVAAAIAYLRILERAGLSPDRAAGQIGFALAVDADFFLSVAKLRALRRLWGRVLEQIGASAAMKGLRLHAETATRMLTRRDPYVNILRTTVATFAAAAGGAASVTVLPFDHALGLPDAFARRIARNTQLVLLEESNLARVIDPAGGSWYVESLTEELAQRAWSVLQAIERQGGMVTALRAGHPQALVEASWAERCRAVATRYQPITGVSEFPDLNEPPRRPPTPDVSALVAAAPARVHEPAAGATTGGIAPIPSHRLSEAFEALRDRSDAIQARTGERPRVFLCNLGRLAEFGARAAFAKNLFEAGGFEAVMSEPMASTEPIGPAFKASGARLAAICSSDANYATMAEEAARALTHAHSTRLYLMGRPAEERRQALEAAGVDEFVHAGADVLATLQRAHAIVGDEAA